jgi:hypothetical protein
MREVLTAMIQAHEIQGGLALENSFNRVGLDHVVLVKVASAAVTSKLLGLSLDQTIDVISQAFVDGQSLRTYRHAPNTGSRKSWAAGDACSRAVNLALLVQKGEMGYPTVYVHSSFVLHYRSNTWLMNLVISARSADFLPKPGDSTMFSLAKNRSSSKDRSPLSKLKRLKKKTPRTGSSKDINNHDITI